MPLKPFAHENERLAAFLERTECVIRPRMAVIETWLRILLDGLRRVVRVLLLELVLRRVVELPADELLDRFHDRVVIARHPDRGERLERIHDADHVGRAELGVDELRDRLADGHARAAADVIVVEEDREQPDVFFRRFGLFVVVGADLLRRFLECGGGAAIELHQLERFDLLRLAVFGDFEITGLADRRPRCRSCR